MLTILLAALLVLLGILAIPLGLDFRLHWQGKFEGDVQLSWLFGLLHVRVSATPGNRSQVRSTRRGRSRRREPSTAGKSTPLSALRLPAFRQRILRFIHDLWRALHKHNVRLLVRLGLDDPADTGRLWSILGPFSAMLASCPEFECDIEPDFTQASLALSSNGRIRVIPLQLLGLCLVLLLSPPFWQGLWKMRGVR